MKSEEIRKKFLKFFEERGHKIVPSSSLIPDDPSVLLTTAGMQQFKPYYIGKADAMRDFGSKNVCSVQKCFRTSDIDEVGDETHLTFFEMLGNFSFGGYWKKEAIKFAYDFIVNELGIDRGRITATVFGGDNEISEDKESFRIWHEEIGLSKEKIKKHSRADNFWGPTGNEGPCGPTTEIYVDGVEIWNVVFNEYYQNSDKSLRKLEISGVDTGMGLERLAVMLQGVKSVFETDLFEPLISKLREVAPTAFLPAPASADSSSQRRLHLAGRIPPSAGTELRPAPKLPHEIQSALHEKALRILADHLRSSIFLVADGLRPSNKEAGYILRRLLRRIMVYEIKYDIHAELFVLAVDIIKKQYADWYPEVKKSKEILDVLMEEKTKFEKAVAQGVKEINKYEKITAHDAFYIYETFGLPFELLQELVPEKVRDLKKEDLEAERKKHQEISRAGVEKKFGGHGLVLDTGELKAANNEEVEKVIRFHTATHLLQQALRDVLGPEIHQMGSDINPERMRFDFNFNRKLTDEELKKVESIVNEEIQKDLPVSFEEMTFEEAKKSGARAFFKEKYPDRVRVYSIGPDSPVGEEGQPYSKEVCGGPHVSNTLKIGKFKITKQEAVGAGTRRIRAVVE